MSKWTTSKSQRRSAVKCAESITNNNKASAGHLRRPMIIMLRICRPKLIAIILTCNLSALAYLVVTGKFSSSDASPIVPETSQIDQLNQIVRRIYGDPKTWAFDTCILPTLNSWDPEIRKIMKDPGPSTCKPTLERLTRLENGTLQVNFKTGNNSEDSPTCRYRCHYPVNDYKTKFDDWAELNAEFGEIVSCDVVEVDCRRNNESIYSFFHTQIVEKPKVTEAPHSDYNFYWIIIDSVSMSMFRRAMHETAKVLQDKFGAVEFPYLNKANLNSRPNAYAMFMGEADTNNWTKLDQLCETPLDSFQYIGFDFQKAGYYTHETEDYAMGVLDWADCVGFKRKHADHFMRPFWAQVGYHKSVPHYHASKTRDRMLNESCKLSHNYMLEHVLEFAGAYEQKPKFSMSWTVELAHDVNENLFFTDVDFAKFFEELHKKSENSFIFLQADHGIRTGKVRDTSIIGAIEDNNPFLYVAVPEKLRENPTIMENLRENSKHVVSHYDLYASAVQIAKFAHSWNETTNFEQAMTPVTDRTLIGSSIFHQMNQPRTCENIAVPPEYCICSDRALFFEDAELATKVAQFLVDWINEYIKNSPHPHADLCLKHKLTEDYPIQLEELRQKSPTERVLRAKFETLPGHALYQGTVKMHEDGIMSLMYTNFPRLNSFSGQVGCIPDGFLYNYCVCPGSVKN